jgi:hypothetical protein
MTAGNDEEFPAEFRPDRREHGKAPQRLDDDRLAELTEEERVAAGIDDYDPDEVPSASDEPPASQDIRDSEEYAAGRDELRRQIEEGEFRDPGPDDPFPPTRYKD